MTAGVSLSATMILSVEMFRLTIPPLVMTAVIRPLTLMNTRTIFPLLQSCSLPGYYSDACIDIVDREDKTNELIGYASYYSNYTRKELLGDVCYFLGCSRNFANKFFKGLRRNDYNYGSQLEEAFDTLVEAWRVVEIEKANKVVDKIMRDYGYKELTKVAQFSNGEAWYDYVK